MRGRHPSTRTCGIPESRAELMRASSILRSARPSCAITSSNSGALNVLPSGPPIQLTTACASSSQSVPMRPTGALSSTSKIAPSVSPPSGEMAARTRGRLPSPVNHALASRFPARGKRRSVGRTACDLPAFRAQCKTGPPASRQVPKQPRPCRNRQRKCSSPVLDSENPRAVAGSKWYLLRTSTTIPGGTCDRASSKISIPSTQGTGTSQRPLVRQTVEGWRRTAAPLRWRDDFRG